MDPLTWLTLTAAMLSASTAVASARRQPTVGLPAAAWACLGLAGLGWALRWWPALVAATLCALVGVLLPIVVFALARRAAGNGHYARAARLVGALAVVRRDRQTARWRDVWGAAAAFHAGDHAPAAALRNHLIAQGDPASEAMADLLALLIRDWASARWARSLDVQCRALCELGEVDAGVEAAGRALVHRLSWGRLRQARFLWLAPLAFAGRVEAVVALTRLVRLPRALASLWHGTALAAAGRTGEAEALWRALSQQTLAPAVQAAVRERLISPPRPHRVGGSAARVVAIAEVEIAAGLRLRGHAWYAEPATLLILASLGVGYLIQERLGGSTNPFGRWLPWALQGGSWPHEPVQLFSYGFLHFGLLHLAVNSLAIAVLGPMLAAALGRVGLIVVFAVAVLGGGVGIALLGTEAFTVGASGGAMGLMGAVAAVLWRHPALRGTATGAAGGRFAIRVVVLQAIFDASMPEVSFAGHAAGAVTGALVALAWMAAARVVGRPAT